MTIGAAVASLAAALVLTGCSSDGDDNGDKGKDKGAADGAAKTPGSGGSDDAGSGDEGATGGSLEGSWVTTTGGKPVALVITGKRATLVGEHVCNGTADAQTLKLKCADGDMDRTDGRVESVDGKTLKVAWQGFGKDEFLKTKNGKLPEGLPTADIPQS
ncbi:hypothetical protein ABT390_13815 [Streptomyces aurantiacus]|uniref:Uncharacterized protein n=1 Tax=Streptomyces aurantiacus JA 4570 TaxID=1286094 RepID=S4ADF4_9ACTN|nr:hypothetical protein [Streptomyces aurantiacus]EPH39487.1 hypothetical protein STRAU_7456 [Streptomyces aurantiacus JA 4570]